jgi:hypothetical protein
MKIHEQHLQICIMQLFQGLKEKICKNKCTVRIFDGCAGGMIWPVCYVQTLSFAVT